MARKAQTQASRSGRKAKVAAPVKRAASPAASKRAPAPKRPPEVTAVKWKGYSPGYRKRLAGFYRLHPGQPLQRGRGHRAGEAQQRRERLEARIEARSLRQSYRGGNYGARDADEIADSYRRLIREQGEGAFTALERLIDARQKGAGPIDTMAELEWDWSDYDGEDSELFYN
jgi:hypothetical protein